MALERGAIINNKYEIQREIGRGGMSVVYLAMDLNLENKPWAIKVIQREGVNEKGKKIFNEVPDDTKLMRRLDYPTIPRIVDIIDNKDDPQIYIVMDYIDGQSLYKLVKTEGKQPEEKVIDWAKQLCGTFQYLHSQDPPIIYRDMKPENVMLTAGGQVKIIDFGIARTYKENQLGDTERFGTRGYASPEHTAKRKQTDQRSDIYTLGMTLFHLVTGADPRINEYAPIRQWDPTLNDGFEMIIDKCVEEDPKKRYQNCQELMKDLENYETLTREYKRRQLKRRNTFISLVSLMLVFIIVGVSSIITGNKIDKNTYSSNIVFDTLAYEEAYENMKNAIEVDSSNVEAYDKFLDYIISSGETSEAGITENEEKNFGAFFNTLQTEYKAGKVSDQEFGEVASKAGEAVMFRYKIDDNSCDISERAKKAFRYFDSVWEYKDNEVVSRMAGFTAKDENSKYLYVCCRTYNITKADKYPSIEAFKATTALLNSSNLLSGDNQENIESTLYVVLANTIKLHFKDLLKEYDKEEIFDALDKIESQYKSVNYTTVLAENNVEYIRKNIDFSNLKVKINNEVNRD